MTVHGRLGRPGRARGVEPERHRVRGPPARARSGAPGGAGHERLEIERRWQRRASAASRARAASARDRPRPRLAAGSRPAPRASCGRVEPGVQRDRHRAQLRSAPKKVAAQARPSGRSSGHPLARAPPRAPAARRPRDRSERWQLGVGDAAPDGVTSARRAPWPFLDRARRRRAAAALAIAAGPQLGTRGRAARESEAGRLSAGGRGCRGTCGGRRRARPTRRPRVSKPAR